MTWTLRYLMSESTTMAGVYDPTPSIVSRYVNVAIMDVASRLPMAEFEAVALSSTSSGENRIYLPGDCEAVLGLSWATAAGGSNWLLPQKNILDIDARSSGTFSGVPEYYVQWETWLELYPSPNSAYSMQLRYRQRLSEITDLEAVPSLNTRFHPAVLYRTAELLSMRAQKPTQATEFYARFESHMRQTPTVDSMRARDRAGFHATIKLRED